MSEAYIGGVERAKIPTVKGIQHNALNTGKSDSQTFTISATKRYYLVAFSGDWGSYGSSEVCWYINNGSLTQLNSYKSQSDGNYSPTISATISGTTLTVTRTSMYNSAFITELIPLDE